MAYLTNKKDRAYIDRRVKIIQEQLNPYLSAKDYTKGDDEDLEDMVKKLEAEIKERDPKYFETIDLYKDNG